MAQTAQAYAGSLAGLLPPGEAWRAEDGSTLGQLLLAMGDMLAAADARADDLMLEDDPRTTVELLPDWERVAGLPDPCAGTAPELETRQQILTAKLIARGGQSGGYFVGVAAALGYAITIEEFQPMNCTSACNSALNTNWRFTWRVHAPEVTISNMTCTTACNAPIRSWGNAVLECTLNTLKPAHTNILFAYDGGA